MAIYFLPVSPSSGEQGQYNRRDVDFLFQMDNTSISSGQTVTVTTFILTSGNA